MRGKARLALVFSAALLAAGCSGSFSLFPNLATASSRESEQATTIETTVIHEAEDTCMVRARNFAGFTPMRCEDVARVPRW